jgi:hypothetical protein
MGGNGPFGAQLVSLWSHSPWRYGFQFRAFYVEPLGAQSCRWLSPLRWAETLISKSYELEKTFIKLPQCNGSLLLGLNTTGRVDCI